MNAIWRYFGRKMVSLEVKNKLQLELKQNNGILFGEKTLVGRGSYCGKNFLTNNKSPADVDERGYWRVERYVGGGIIMIFIHV